MPPHTIERVERKHKYYVTRIALDQFQHVKTEPADKRGRG